MVKTSSLAGYAITFVVGYAIGMFHHHIAHVATSGDSLDGSVRMRSVETRLAQVEARLALGSGAAESAAAVPQQQPQQQNALPYHATSAKTAIVASHEQQHATSSVAHGSTSGQAVRSQLAAADDGCPAGRKPYHVVLTAQDSTYQAWQTRIMVHHLKRIQKQNRCSEITGFTRLLSSPNGAHDALSAQIPTVTVKELTRGMGCHSPGSGNTCDMGFPVMNRPHAVTQLLANWPSQITEEYVLIAETDHIFLTEPPNRATPTKPACFPFGYMNAKAPELRPTVARFVDDPDTVDPCGPSPVLIHVDTLRKLTPEWLRLSFELKRDAEANKLFGWVLEMWGYTMAANKHGIAHLVWQNLQTEPSALWHTNLDGNPHIYHYTFGLEFTVDGLPVTTIGDWSLDKRHYMAYYPPKQLEPPPACAGKAAATLHAMFNEASGNISDWPTGPPDPARNIKGTRGWEVASGHGDAAIEATFVGQKHVVTFDACWGFESVRASDGDRASGVAKIEPPPKQEACPKL